MPAAESHSPVVVLGAEEELWRQRVGALDVIPQLLHQFGVDPAPVLADAGLEASALDLADNTIPYAAFGLIMGEGARRSRCEHFGLLVGQAWHLSSLGLLGQLIRHSATVGDALRSAIVHHHLNTQGGVVFLNERDAMAELGYAIYHRGTRGISQVYDGVLASLVNLMRELCGPAWAPIEVRLAHAAPADTSPYRRLFRCPVRFDSEVNALRFKAEWLSQPVTGADAMVLRVLERQVSVLAQPELIEKLQRSLRVLLLHRVVSGDAVADMLAMHRRTLNRRLAALGTTFRDVLEEVRFEAARQLLSATHLPLDDVAVALGYSELSSFNRAFRRASGTSPGQWRRDAQAHDEGRCGSSADSEGSTPDRS
jgi:AraC-like DNA-binding protein